MTLARALAAIVFLLLPGAVLAQGCPSPPGCGPGQIWDPDKGACVHILA